MNISFMLVKMVNIYEIDYLPPEKQEICIDFNPLNKNKKENFYHLDILVPYREGDFHEKEKRVKK